MSELPMSFVYRGEPTRDVHLAPDGTTFRLCSKEDSDCVVSVRLDEIVVAGDTVSIPPFTLSQA